MHASQGWSINADGSAEFHSIILPSGQGVSVFIAATPPVTTHVGDLWYDTSNGLRLNQWSGSAWTPFQIGTNAISAGAVTAAQIAANTITAGNIAAGTLTGVYTGAAYFGQNMIQDPAFSSSLLNAVRTGDPVTNAVWTLSGGTAAVTAGTPAKRLALMPSGQPDFFVIPGEQFYLSVTGTTTASCQVGIEIVYDNGSISTVSGTFSGTQTVTGNITVPAGAKSGYIRIFAFTASGTPTATLSNPACYFGQLLGPDYIINGSGYFLYSGTPALGNLIASDAAASGTDTFGNTYYAGRCVYAASGGASPNLVGQLLSGVLALGSNAQLAGTGGATAAFLSAQIGAGEVALYSGTESSSDGAITLSLWSKLQGGVGVPFALLGGPLQLLATGVPTGAGPYLYTTSLGTPAAVTTGTLTGTLALSQTDNGTATVTQTTFTRLSKAWSIPANDAQAGTVYRLTAAGTATWGSTQQALDFGINGFGVSPVTTGLFALPIGPTEFSASLALVWRLQAEVYVAATGTGTANIAVGMSCEMGVSGANQLTQVNTNQSAGGFSSYSNTATGTTTSAENITLQAKWASTTGAPTITCNYSILERLGT